MNVTKTHVSRFIDFIFNLDFHGTETDKTENYWIFPFPNLVHVGRCFVSILLLIWFSKKFSNLIDIVRPDYLVNPGMTCNLSVIFLNFITL